MRVVSRNTSLWQTDRQTDRRRDASTCLWKEVVVHVYGYVRRLYRRTVDRLYLGLGPVPRVLLPIRVADHPVLPHHDLRKFPARPQPLPPPPPPSSSSSSSSPSLSSFSYIRHNQLTWATIYTNKETDRQTDRQTTGRTATQNIKHENNNNNNNNNS